MKRFVSQKKYDELEKQNREYFKFAEEVLKLNREHILKGCAVQIPFKTQITLSETCNTCLYCDLNVEILETRDCIGYEDVFVEIHCKHENVCKKVSDENANQSMGKR